MTVTPITGITAYVPTPISSVELDKGFGVAPVPVQTVTTSTPNKTDNAEINTKIENSAELLNQVGNQYSYKSPIARLKETINQSQKSNTEKNSKVNANFESELNVEEENYSISEVIEKKVNKGYYITLPQNHLVKYGEKSRIDQADFTIRSTYNPNLITRNGSLVNLTL